MEAELCRCGHPFDPHIFVCTNNNDPLLGGLMFCQELDTCTCVNTWGPSAGGQELNPDASIMPPEHVIEEWRQALREQA